MENEIVLEEVSPLMAPRLVGDMYRNGRLLSLT